MDGSLYQGMTIHNLLEKVDLRNFVFEEDVEVGVKETEKPSDVRKTVVRVPEPTSAYLGPRNIFSNPITLDDLIEDDSFTSGELLNIKDVFEQTASPPTSSPISPEVMTSPSIIMPVVESNLQKGGNDFLYVESKRARLAREKEERKRKFEVDLDFAPEDIALATVPGVGFDPKTRKFELEDLRPQPIIKKRKKIAVPEELKDEKYWEKREKNTEATRRSREAKRLKENQIVLRAAYLEKENEVLKQELDSSKIEKSKLETEIGILKRKLETYESSF